MLGISTRTWWMWGAILGLATLALAVETGGPPEGAGASAPQRMSMDGPQAYGSACARCHGLAGRGDGPAAAMLTVRPTDFTTGRFKFRSTEPGSLPADVDLVRSIRDGIPGSAMPAFADLLSEAEIAGVVAVVKSFSPRFAKEQPRPLPSPGRPVPSSPESLARGRKVYERLGCAVCHGPDGRAAGAQTVALRDTSGNPAEVPNLDEPWTFGGGSAPADLYLRFVTGIDGTPMPSYSGSATSAELWDLANHVASLARKPVWEMNDSELARFYQMQDKADRFARGRYLVETMSCSVCHTPMRADGGLVEELRFAGGMHYNVGPFGDVYTPNITSDRETGLGAWTDEQIKQAITKGLRPDGSYMLPFPMPWISYGTLSDADVDAIVAYLRTIPPIRNRVPENRPAGFFTYLRGKFNILILKKDFPSLAYPGNAGDAPVPEESLHPPVPVVALKGGEATRVAGKGAP